MNEAVSTAQALANAGDRAAFFAALLVIGFVGLWGARYLVAQNRELVQSLTASHVGYATKLEGLVKEQGDMVRENTRATAAQTEALRSHSETLKALSRHLDRAT